MKTTSIESAALAQVGPRQTRAEAETAAFLLEMDAISAQINATPREQRMERSAAVLAGIMRPADAEAVRAAYWTRLPLAARMVALMAARLPKERAKDALMTFDALERGLMWVAIEKLTGQLSMAQKCMNGGRMPSTGSAVH